MHQQRFPHEFLGRPSVKDLIESIGIPHTEVALILVDGEPVTFSYKVDDGDWISAYPHFRSFEVSSLPAVSEARVGKLRFVLDTHLGRLARYLRMLGFDTFYQNDFEDSTLARISADEDRVLLTQDVGLLKRSVVTRGYFVRASNPRGQLVEVAVELDLLETAKPFTRCLRCNGVLTTVPKSEIENRLLPRTQANFDEFYRCESCGTLYWKGSHFDRMNQIIDELQATLRSPRVQE